MTQKATLPEIVALAAELARDEQAELAQILLDMLHAENGEGDNEPYDLLNLIGLAPNLLGGEDAQEWVSRSRREGTEAREAVWKRGAVH